jgi:hypothetical protein
VSFYGVFVARTLVPNGISETYALLPVYPLPLGPFLTGSNLVGSDLRSDENRLLRLSGPTS